VSDITVSRLAELETVIERGLETYIEVGSALLEIRDSRLYREPHGTFEDYCRERWSISKVHASRLISASRIVEDLVPIGTTLPASESVAPCRIRPTP